MNHGRKRFPASRPASKQGPPLGFIVLALACGAVLGSGGTYLYFKPLVAAKQSAPPAGGATSPAQTATITPQPQRQYTPAPQPPGEPPPGKVWSVEHGHWHDAPAAPVVLTPAPAALTPPATPTPAPAPAALTPAAATPPAPVAEPK